MVRESPGCHGRGPEAERVLTLDPLFPQPRPCLSYRKKLWRCFLLSRLPRIPASRGKVRPRALPCRMLSSGTDLRPPPSAYYIITRLLSTLALQPLWFLLHFSPFSPFPASGSLRETLQVRSMRRLAYLIASCDLRLAQRGLRLLPPKKELKETRAIWIPPAGGEWIKGVGKSDEVSTVRVPGYVWGKGKDDEGEMKVGPGENVVLFFHGGGLAVGSAHEDYLASSE